MDLITQILIIFLTLSSLTGSSAKDKNKQEEYGQSLKNKQTTNAEQINNTNQYSDEQKTTTYQNQNKIVLTNNWYESDYEYVMTSNIDKSRQKKYSIITTFGIYPIKKSRSSAKQNAVNEALKEAVKYSITEIIRSDSDISSNINLIYDAVENHAEKFIVSYKLIGESVQKDKFIAAVESKINKDVLLNFFKQKGVINVESDHNDINSSDKNSAVKTIKINIEGSDHLSSFIMLRKTLNSMSGIKDVQTRDLSSDQAVVNILFNGTGNYLASRLMLTNFDDFKLVLSNITEDSLTIRFMPKADGAAIDKLDMEGAYISE